ncbi:inositol monophosphatase [Candidatus Micrarchaeota archaeon]|nr:inositol monophosphatase [Candidatus Micrarchaeota archaeon]
MFLKDAEEMARKAGEIINKGYYTMENETEVKLPKDFVTKIDKESEKIIRKMIKEKYPEHGIIGEEYGKEGEEKEYVWIIDPLDGTTNFIHRIPMFAVSIALKKNRETILGIVYNPVTNEMFYAEKEKGAFLNGKKIKPSEEELENWFMGWCFPDSTRGQKVENAVYSIFFPRTLRLTKLGTAALELCYSACGRIDSYIGIGLKEWDYSAGEFIVREAGGKVIKKTIHERNVIISGPKNNVELIDKEVSTV